MVDVSVVIPCFNASLVISRALLSIAEQSEPPREVVVVDDGSSDRAKTFGLVQEVQRGIPVKTLSVGVNRGPSAARNLGIGSAVGEYVAFLDADDVWHRRKLEIQYELVVRERLSLCGHGYVAEVGRGESLGVVRGRPRVSRIGMESFVTKNPFFTPTVMVRREQFVGFDEKLRMNEDFKAWVLMVAREDVRAGYIDVSLAGGYKRGVGVGGLSASVSGLHRTRIAALRSLRGESGRVSRAFVLSALLIEALKYPMRIVRVGVMRLRDRMVRGG